MTSAIPPQGWRSVPASDLITISHGFAFKGEYFSEHGRDAVTTPGNFLESGGFRHTGTNQRYYSGSILPSYRLSAGDLIVAMTEQAEGLLGSTAFVPHVGSWLHNQRIGRIRARSEEVSLKYLFYVFNSFEFRRSVTETAAGTKVKHTSPAKLGAVEILLPPRDEQERIAEKLNDVGTMILGLERLIAKKWAIKQGMMRQLLTGKTRLVGFSGEWKVRRVGEFARVIAGGTPARSVPRYWGGGIRWMSSGELHQGRVCEVAGRITEDGLRESSAQIVPRGSVLIGLAGQGKTRGTVAISQVELTTNQSVAAILPSGDHFSDFLYYNLDTRYEEIRAMSTGAGGRGGLNLTIIKSIHVHMPDLVEQNAIALALSDIDSEIEVLNFRLAKEVAIRQGMMQQLLSGRTRLPMQESAA